MIPRRTFLSSLLASLPLWPFRREKAAPAQLPIVHWQHELVMLPLTDEDIADNTVAKFKFVTPEPPRSNRYWVRKTWRSQFPSFVERINYYWLACGADEFPPLPPVDDGYYLARVERIRMHGKPHMIHVDLQMLTHVVQTHGDYAESEIMVVDKNSIPFCSPSEQYEHVCRDDDEDDGDDDDEDEDGDD